MILAPGEDTVLVEDSVFIVDDERGDTVAEALFHHDEPADAAVIILEGMDLFKTNMKI